MAISWSIVIQFSLTISESAVTQFSLTIFGSPVTWFSLTIPCVYCNSVFDDDFEVSSDIVFSMIPCISHELVLTNDSKH
jgi:hypothetical protein